MGLERHTPAGRVRATGWRASGSKNAAAKTSIGGQAIDSVRTIPIVLRNLRWIITRNGNVRCSL